MQKTNLDFNVQRNGGSCQSEGDGTRVRIVLDFLRVVSSRRQLIYRAGMTPAGTTTFVLVATLVRHSCFPFASISTTASSCNAVSKSIFSLKVVTLLETIPRPSPAEPLAVSVGALLMSEFIKELLIRLGKRVHPCCLFSLKYK